MKPLRAVPALAAALVLTACASIGRPEGGARDEVPPQFVRSNPAPGELNVDRTTINIIFDENIQLEDAFNKVVVSPVQLQAAQVSSNGRRVTVRLRDTLVKNTTYTIDFGDAIKDLNEGNVLDGFALDFSTGTTIDSLRISGIVLAAENLEPAQGIIVGAYSNLEDSAIRTLPPDRIARTNQYGQFTIRNLSPGTYRVYALNDVNRDWHWDRSEDVAFLDSLVVPRPEEILVTDTLYSHDGSDSLASRRGIMYLPNDVLLTSFNQNYRAQYLQDYKRPNRRQVTIALGAPPDSLPRVSLVDGVADSAAALLGSEMDRWGIPVFSQEHDSLTLWLTDPAVYGSDSLRLAVSYRKPDSLEQLQWTSDTLRFFYRDPKRSKKEIEADTLPRRYDVMQLTTPSGGTMDVYRRLSLLVDQPLERIDTAAIHFEMLNDTVWTPLPFTLEPDSLDPVLTRTISHIWTPGTRYRITADSAAIYGVYGEHNKAFAQEFTVKNLEDYSGLVFRISGADSTAIVELLNGSDSPLRRAPVIDGRATFKYLNPGTYYARVFFDANGDGLWTTGMLDSIQPEEVAYFSKKLDLKKNWDIEQDWDIYELPLDRQKPYALLKNKPKLKRGEKDPRDTSGNDSEDEDEFIGPNRQGLPANNRNNGLGGLSTGGFRQTTTL